LLVTGSIQEALRGGAKGGSMSSFFTCFNRKRLEEILPHRGAALRKIDGVFYRPGDSGVMLGVKRIAADDPDLEGHFPGAPTYPGYALDEFICLVAAALVAVENKGLEKNPHVVQKTVRYKKGAGPGDILTAEVRRDGRRGRFIIFSGTIGNQDGDAVAHYERIVGAV
jgi:3-hydroxyacyl-[acyl-carrier-protein] dehydratase